jgi:hypothetical protein
MSYDLSIQPKDPKAIAQRSQVESFITSLPGVRLEGPGIFAHGDAGRPLFVQIYAGESDTIDSVDVSVPAAFSGASGDQALLVCFQIAEHLGWQVFDPQLGDFLDRSTAAEVLRSRKDYGDTEDEVLGWLAARKASLGEIYAQQLYCHTVWVLIPTLIGAALLAGYFVVQRGVSESRFPWLFFGAAAVIHGLRALVCTIWQRVRGEKKRAA